MLLQLSHLSAKDFLQSDNVSPDVRKHFHSQEGRSMLADVCASYLFQIDGKTSAESIERQLPFAQYCAENWYVFAATARTEPYRVLEKILKYLEPRGVHSVIYRTVHRMDDDDKYWKRFRSESSDLADALYYVAYAGLVHEFREIVARGANVNAQGGLFGNALQAAAYRGHREIAGFLLDAGADVNAQGGDYNNALFAATATGNRDIVQLLLDKRADPNITESVHQSALQIATVKGHHERVQLLLEGGAGPNAAKGQYPRSALHIASAMGDWKTVQLLLDKGADPDATDSSQDSVLQIVLRKGDSKIVKLLLEANANVNT